MLHVFSSFFVHFFLAKFLNQLPPKLTTQTNNRLQQIRNFDVVNKSSNFWSFEYAAEFVDDTVNHTKQIWLVT